MDDIKNYPALNDFKNKIGDNNISAKMPEQIDILTAKYGEEYLCLAEKVFTMLQTLGLNPVEICLQYLFDYLQQMRIFLKTGEYGHTDYEEIKKTIYDNAEVMMDIYMPGLFWAYSSTTILYTKYHLFLNKFLSRLSHSLDGIEVGFGEGFYLWELNNHIPNIKITGFDISEHALAFASKLLKAANIPSDNYNLLIGNVITGLPLDDSSKDYAILAEVIEHIPSPDIAISEIARILKTGGLFYVTTVINSNHMDHITNFESPEYVEKILNQAGFTILDKSIYYLQDDFPKSKDISVGLAFVCELKK